MATNWKVPVLIVSTAACLAVAVYTLYVQESNSSKRSIKRTVKDSKCDKSDADVGTNAEPHSEMDADADKAGDHNS